MVRHVIIIGGGHDGLSAAATLAGAGRSVPCADFVNCGYRDRT